MVNKAKIWFTLSILIISSLPSMAQEIQTIFQIDQQGVVVVDSTFIEPVYNAKCYKYAYTLDNPAIEVRVGESVYTIKTGRFDLYKKYNEPGDFDVIEISKDSKRILTVKDDSGIIKLHESPCCQREQYISQFAKNNYFVEIPLSESAKVVYFMGYWYGTDLSKAFIFVLTENDAKLVHNKKLMVNSLTGLDDGCKMVLESTYSEFDIINDVEYIYPAAQHTMWVEDGVLKFKDNNNSREPMPYVRGANIY